MGKKLAGFGLGPIQAGLMLHEANRSGTFDAYTIIEVDPALVEGVRAAGGVITVNVAACLLTDQRVRKELACLWQGEKDDGYMEECRELTVSGLERVMLAGAPEAYCPQTQPVVVC